MKVELATFAHSNNGLSLYVQPETEAERQLLRGIWKHGKLEVVNSHGDDKSGIGFAITWKIEKVVGGMAEPWPETLK